MKLKTRAGSSSGRSIVFISAVGIIIALTLSFFLSAGLTSLVMSNKLSESSTSPFTFAIRTVAVLAGALIGTVFAKDKYFVNIGIIALGYLIILLGLGITLYDGSFQNFGTGILSVIVGGSIGYLIRLKSQNKTRRTKKSKR